MTSSPDIPNRLSFKPFAHSWVAIHPEPQGIIQFVGSFFIFGSIPTFFYRSLFKSLYAKNYTIIAYPTAMIPPLIWKSKLVDHWSASIDLLREEYAVKSELINYLLSLPNPPSVDIYLDQSNYYWLGHSLGCKYISLLEILSNDLGNLQTNLQKCGFTPTDFELVAQDLVKLEEERNNTDNNINALLRKNSIDKIVSSASCIKDQPAIFLAPEIHGTAEVNGKTETAIPFFEVFPSGAKTLSLIRETQGFFQLTALIAFSYDNISKDDVAGLKKELQNKSTNFICKEFAGCDFKIELLTTLASHLKPVGSDIEPLGQCINKIYIELKNRLSPSYTEQVVDCYPSVNCP